jgi:hypothetical protein
LEGKERRGKELTRGTNSPEREERKESGAERGNGRRQAGLCGSEREREGRERGVAGLGRSGPGRGPHGREGRGESWAAGEGEEMGLGWLGWALFLSFFLSQTQFQFKQSI